MLLQRGREYVEFMREAVREGLAFEVASSLESGEKSL